MIEQATDAVLSALGSPSPDLFARLTDHVVARHREELAARIKTLDWELFDQAAGAAVWTAIEELRRSSRANAV